MVHVRNMCKFSDKDYWCTNENSKRSLFGLGYRRCKYFPNHDTKCELYEQIKRPKLNTIPPRGVKQNETIININLQITGK